MPILPRLFLLRAFPLGWMLFGGLFGLILWLALLALLVVLIVSVVRDSRYGRASARANDALEILKARYARGEITKEDYDNMRHTLTT